MGKPYPKWTDFPIDDVMYGLGAPFVGIGIYTWGKKFSWPDPEGTTKEEYDNWVKHLESEGYDVPEEYRDAYVAHAVAVGPDRTNET